MLKLITVLNALCAYFIPEPPPFVPPKKGEGNLFLNALKYGTLIRGIAAILFTTTKTSSAGSSIIIIGQSGDNAGTVEGLGQWYQTGGGEHCFQCQSG